MSRFLRYSQKVFDLGVLVAYLKDTREKPQIPVRAIWGSALAMFLTRRNSINGVQIDLRWPSRMNGIVGMRKPGGDRIGQVYELMDPDSQREILKRIHHQLSRNKALNTGWAWRFLALDGHELFKSRRMSWKGCSKRKIKLKNKEVTEYYQQCVVCHLIGCELAVPIDVELISSQEGESTAAKRLIKRVIENYPRFFDGVSGDALYMQAPLINLCLKHGKHVVVTAKGDKRLIMQDAQSLFDSMKPEIWRTSSHPIRVWDAEGFTSCEGVKEPLRILRTEETTTRNEHYGDQVIQKTEVKNFWWATTMPKSLLPTKTLWQIGHARWDIEDDLFNVLAGHWGMDHCFRHHSKATLNFLLTLFISFILVESFYRRNLKPALRAILTVIALRDSMHAELFNRRVLAPWFNDS